MKVEIQIAGEVSEDWRREGESDEDFKAWALSRARDELNIFIEDLVFLHDVNSSIKV